MFFLLDLKYLTLSLFCEASSSRYCNIWVVLPLPVSPVISTTCPLATADNRADLWGQIGRSCLAAWYSGLATGGGTWATPPPSRPRLGLVSLDSAQADRET